MPSGWSTILSTSPLPTLTSQNVTRAAEWPSGANAGHYLNTMERLALLGYESELGTVALDDET